MVAEKLKYYFFEYLFEHPFTLIALISGFLPLIFCLFNFKKIWESNKVLFLYAVSIFLLETIGNYFSALSKNNHNIYLIFYLVESIFLVVYYNFKIKFNYYTIISFSILGIVILGFILNLIDPNNLMNNYSGTIQSLGFIVISLVNFYIILSSLNIQKLTESTLFWINSGSFFYFSGKFFVSLFMINILDKSKPDLDYWDIVTFVLLFYRILFCIGLTKIAKT